MPFFFFLWDMSSHFCFSVGVLGRISIFLGARVFIFWRGVELFGCDTSSFGFHHLGGCMFGCVSVVCVSVDVNVFCN